MKNVTPERKYNGVRKLLENKIQKSVKKKPEDKNLNEV